MTQHIFKALEWRFAKGSAGEGSVCENRCTRRLGCQRRKASRKIHEPKHQATVKLGVHVVKCEPPSPWNPKFSNTGSPAEETSSSFTMKDRCLGINAFCLAVTSILLRDHPFLLLVNGRELAMFCCVSFEREPMVIYYLLGLTYIFSISAPVLPVLSPKPYQLLVSLLSFLIPYRMLLP